MGWSSARASRGTFRLERHSLDESRVASKVHARVRVQRLAFDSRDQRLAFNVEGPVFNGGSIGGANR
jgi:hypothetical protein